MSGQSTKVFYWFDDEYRVTNHKDAGVTMIEKLVKRNKRGEKWQVIYDTHTELLVNMVEFLATPNKDSKLIDGGEGNG